MGNQDGDHRGYRAAVDEAMKRLLYASAVLVLIAAPALVIRTGADDRGAIKPIRRC